VLVPEGGLSSIDGPGRPFDDPAANAALVAAIADALSGSSNGKLVRLPYHINDPEFADAIVTEFAELMEL
jgi:uncharacterized protein (UPF0261 family)